MSWIPSYKKPGYEPPYIPSWSEGTDEEIIAILESHYNNEIDLTHYWSVGDERAVSLNYKSGTIPVGSNLQNVDAQTITLVLSEIGGQTLETPINGHTECVFQVDMKDCLLSIGKLGTNQEYSWPGCGRYNWCNGNGSAGDGDLYEAFPSSIRSIFKRHLVLSTLGTSATGLISTYCYFSLRSMMELFGYSPSGVAQDSTQQIEYYKTSSNRIKKVNGVDSDYYTRSSRYFYNKNTGITRRGDFQYVTANNSYSSAGTSGSGTYDRGLSFFGVI